MQCSFSSVMSRAGGFEFLNNCLWPFCNRCKVSITRYAAALSSLSVPRLTIIEPASGSGHCNVLASSHGAHPDSRALAWSGSSALLSDIPTTQRLRFVRSRAIPRLFAFAQLCDVSNIEQRLRIRGCILILSPRSPRHLPVTESIVLPLLDQGASYAVHSTHQLRAQKQSGKQ